VWALGQAHIVLAQYQKKKDPAFAAKAIIILILEMKASRTEATYLLATVMSEVCKPDRAIP
jgi:hypothetical protein